ncbi:ABC transporter substrate-binding protein [Nitratireductor pacificus]|uniref:ABC transporter substrate binding protein n=1 Tax=Nitratireductor pacificus pht-3B TaxID=391937 RepID=K2LN46_9HYPH|nr:substrate-binding domain-containing protein [Nitratireductor pacificus]EKF19164.1 ABC transporter substrate binding protein [Nitratireductor pacificus pht-3B]
MALLWLALSCTAGAAQSSAGAEACRLQVLTSFPESFFHPFVELFSAASNATVCVTNKNTISLLRHVQENRLPAPDVIWASSPVAFAVLDAEGMLVHRPDKVRPAADFSGIEVDDPNGSRFGFALSHMGVMWKQRADDDLPKRLDELAAPGYAGKLGISSPARSGTTHLFVETILQEFGWDAGWALLSRIGANVATVTARSFGVRDGVAKDRFQLGVGIDFLAKAEGRGQPPLGFAPLSPHVVFPASAGIFIAGENNPLSEAFIDFLRSEAGQNLLLRPDIARIPVAPALWSQAGFAADPDPARPLDMRHAARRLPVVTALFDEMITYRHTELAELWSAVDRFAGDERIGRSQTMRALLADVRDLLESVPVASFMSDADELVALLARGTAERMRDLRTAEGTDLRDSWSRDFSSRFRKAREIVARIDAYLGAQAERTAP